MKSANNNETVDSLEPVMEDLRKDGSTEENKEKKQLGSLAHLFQFLNPYKLTCLCAAIALLFTAGITLLVGQGIKLVIDQGFMTGSTEQLSQSIVFLLLLAVLLAMGTYIRFYLVSWLGERVSADIRSAVFNHLVHLHPSYFELNRSGEIMSRLTTDTTLLQSIIGSSFSLALRSAITSSGALIMLLFTSIKLTAVIVLGVPLVLLPVLLYGRRVRSLSRKSQESIADVGSYAGEIIQQIKTVQSYTSEEYEKTAFSKEVETAFDIAKQRIKQRAALMAAVILMVFCALTIMLWIGGTDVMTGTMSAGELGSFVFYALLVAIGVATLSEVYGELQRAAGATDRLLELLDVKNEIIRVEMKENEKHDEMIESLPFLEFKSISFSYPSRSDQYAINNLNLDIPESKVTALVGPSGAGKSTIFELLQRFYDPNDGSIYIAGQDIRSFEPVALRAEFALVSQQPSLFTATVAQNIAYGNLKATQQDIERAAKAAQIHEFINQLPMGYDSFLGEQGVRLSGGQKQRVAIARAILRDPHILLLDEATSALDTESEHLVKIALDKLMKGRTTIIIAHRLSTVIHADQIIVLDKGQLVAKGTHAELLDSSDLYARLAKLQFDRASS